MLQLSGYGTLGDGTPHINGKPASRCTCEHEGCPAVLIPNALAPWLCPECGAHLAASGICLNACHLTAAQLRRFEQGMAEAWQEVRGRHNGAIFARARALYDEARARWPQRYAAPWEQLAQGERQHWHGQASQDLGVSFW